MWKHVLAVCHLELVAVAATEIGDRASEADAKRGNVHVVFDFKGENATEPTSVGMLSEKMILAQSTHCHGRCMTCQRDPLLFPDSCSKCCSQYNWCGGGPAWCNWGTDCQACLASTTTSTTVIRQRAACPLLCTYCLRDHDVWRDSCDGCCSRFNWCGKGAAWCEQGTDCSACIKDLHSTTTTTSVRQQPSSCPSRCTSCRRDTSVSVDSCNACCSRYNWCGTGTDWCGAGGIDCSECVANLRPGSIRLLEVPNSTVVSALMSSLKLSPDLIRNGTTTTLLWRDAQLLNSTWYIALLGGLCLGLFVLLSVCLKEGHKLTTHKGY